jgi:hypothetical protein
MRVFYFVSCKTLPDEKAGANVEPAGETARQGRGSFERVAKNYPWPIPVGSTRY